MVYESLHLGAIPVKSHTGATREEAVMHCGNIGLLIDEQVKHLEDSSGVSSRPFKLMYPNNEST